MIFSLYSKETGEFCGSQLSGPLDVLAVNVPAGMALMPGAHDALRNVVVSADDGFGSVTPVVRRRKPPRPADTEYVQWNWSDLDDDWVAVLTTAGRVSELRAERNRLLSLTDVAVRGGLERLLVDVATQLGVPVDASLEALLSYRQQLRDAPARPDFSALQPADLTPPSSQE